MPALIGINRRGAHPAECAGRRPVVTIMARHARTPEQGDGQVTIPRAEAVLALGCDEKPGAFALVADCGVPASRHLPLSLGCQGTCVLCAAHAAKGGPKPGLRA